LTRRDKANTQIAKKLKTPKRRDPKENEKATSRKSERANLRKKKGKEIYSNLSF